MPLFVSDGFKPSEVLGAADMVLTTLTGVDSTSVAQTTMYSIPSGRQVVVLGIRVRVTAADSITAGATANVHISTPGDIIASDTWTNLFSVDDVYHQIASGQNIVGQSPNNVILDITTGATGTSQTVSVDLIGYLL